MTFRSAFAFCESIHDSDNYELIKRSHLDLTQSIQATLCHILSWFGLRSVDIINKLCTVCHDRRACFIHAGPTACNAWPSSQHTCWIGLRRLQKAAKSHYFSHAFHVHCLLFYNFYFYWLMKCKWKNDLGSSLAQYLIISSWPKLYPSK